VPCNQVDNLKFKENGLFFENYGNQTWLCPEKGDIDYSGNVGTNLWVMAQEGFEDLTSV
jgi:hypothetical protein